MGKAEFDSLKSDFQAQIDHYNTSIDNKIDGSIAAYLAGIKIGTEPINTWRNMTNAMGADLWFANTVAVSSGTYASTAGKNDNKAQLFVNAARHVTYRYSKFNYAFHAWGDGGGGGLEFGVNPSSRSMPSSAWNSSVYKLWGTTRSGSGWSAYSSGLSDWGSPGSWSENYDTNNVNVVADAASLNNDGDGTGWVYHKRADGNKILREYCSKICPGQILDTQWHTYSNKTVSQSWSYYTSSNGLSDTTSSVTITVTGSTDYGVASSGTKRADGSTTSNSQYWKRNQFKVSSSNTKDYSVIQWGAGVNTEIYTFADDIKPTNDTAVSLSIPQSKWNNIYFTSSGPQLSTNTANGYTVKYSPLKFTPEKNYLYSFINESISTAAGEIVNIGGGAPLFETTSNDQELELTINFKVRNGGTHNSSSGTVNYVIADKQFNKGNLASDAKKYASGTATAGTPVKISFQVSNKSLLWINMSAGTAGDEASINTFVIKTK